MVAAISGMRLRYSYCLVGKMSIQISRAELTQLYGERHEKGAAVR
jgi:hypothetical protein